MATWNPSKAGGTAVRCARCAFARLHEEVRGGVWRGCADRCENVQLEDGDGAAYIASASEAERRRIIADLLALIGRELPEVVPALHGFMRDWQRAAPQPGQPLN